MARENKYDKKFEKNIAAILERNFSVFLKNIKDEGLEVAQKMGLDFKGMSSQETKNRFSQQVEKRVKKIITNSFRLYFSRVIDKEGEPFVTIKYLIEIYEGAIKILKSSNKIRVSVPGDIPFSTDGLNIFFDAYLEILEDVFKELKFEYEVTN